MTPQPWRSRTRRGLRLLGLAVRSQPLGFAVALAGSTVYAAMSVATAWLLGQLVDRLGEPQTADPGPVLGWLLAAAFAQALGFAGRETGSAVMRYRLQADLRVRLVERFATLPPGSTGDLLSIVDSDVELTWQAVRILPAATSALLMLAGGIAAMFATGATFGWIGLALLVCSLCFAIAYENRAGPRLAHLQEVRGEVAALAQESFEAALLVKATGREDAETARFAAAAQRLRRAGVATGRVRAAFDPVMEALPNLGVLATILVGSLGIASGTIRPGAVVQVAFLIALVALPLSSIGWIISEFPLNATAYARAEAVLDRRREAVGDDPGPSGPGPARIDLVSAAARQPGAAEPFPLTLSVDPGRWVVLAGRSGSGKSTVCALLAGVQRPSAGAVRLDGVDLHRLAPSARITRIAFVPQQSFLFRDTVRANISLGRSVGDDAIWSALRLAQADGFVAALPAGLDTGIGERGHTLSGGQRQRLALARALAGHPGLLVLDDATSAVDPRVETAILDGLATLRPGLTVVMATAGLAAVARADEIVYLHRGAVSDRGPHAALLARCAGYRELIVAAQRDRERHAGRAG